jgi:RNA polymerase sigma factor (sigma-70 family)
VTQTEESNSIAALCRIELPRLIARLTRLLGDVGTAEEIAQEALVSAFVSWPESGVPDNPAAWLMAVSKRRALDELRRQKMVARKHEQLQDEWPAQELPPPDFDTDDFGDDLLRLVFTACHPVLSTDARVALTLRVLGGLTTDEIARAFLTSEPTIAQRIVRAKRVLSDAKVGFEVPHGDELAARLSSVLEVIYLIFNEGYSATSGASWMRPDLCADALRLGRTLVALAPEQAEVHGLLALMELQAARMAARRGPTGEPVLLLDQNRALWDPLLIQRGLSALARAERQAPERGPYTLQAAIAASHARAPTASETNWAAIAELYAELGARMPSPVVELNRAVAVSMAFGPERALPLLQRLQDERALPNYHLLPSVLGDVLFRLGRLSEARAQFQAAAAMTRNESERALLLARAEKCEYAAT